MLPLHATQLTYPGPMLPPQATVEASWMDPEDMKKLGDEDTGGPSNA